MQYRQESEWGAVEDHWYFPEWADRPEASGSLHEVDVNSYLAGGYAEEFGHRAPAVSVRSPSPPVEENGEWRVQVGGLHPGYPECPRPLDRGTPGRRSDPGFGSQARPTSVDASHKSPVGFRVVFVGRDAKERARYGIWLPLKAFWIRRSRLPLS